MSTKDLEVEAQKALAALSPAERVALATGTHLVQAVDGKPVLVLPRSLAELDAEEAAGAQGSLLKSRSS